MELGDTKVEGFIIDEERKFPLLKLIEKKKKSDDKDKDKDNNNNNNGNNNNNNNGNSNKKEGNKNKISHKQVFLKLLNIVSKKDGKAAEAMHDGIVAWLKEKKGKMKDKYPTKVAIYSLKELLFAEGIDQTTLLGGEDKKKRKVTGFADYVTIWSKGKVNINTAPAQVLLSLSDKMTNEIANAIVAKRKNREDIFKKTTELPQKVSEVTKSVFGEIQDKIGVASEYFRITATATTENVTKQLVAVVHRQEKKVYTIYCEIK